MSRDKLAEDRQHLGNKRKTRFFFVFHSVCTIFVAVKQKQYEENFNFGPNGHITGRIRTGRCV